MELHPPREHAALYPQHWAGDITPFTPPSDGHRGKPSATLFIGHAIVRTVSRLAGLATFQFNSSQSNNFPLPMPQLLLLEDDPAIARTVIYALEREGLQVSHRLLLQDARKALETTSFDALILDVGLPDGNGLDLCKEVQGQIPVLILSARSEEFDCVLGLEMGADDYLTKPFSPRELAARIKALLRRSRINSASLSGASAPARVANTVASAADWVDDGAGQRIFLRGHPLLLTRREYQLLRALLQGAGRILSRDTLLRAAWGDDSESIDRTVDTHIKTLRAKLRDIEPLGDYIVTHRGMGYSLRTRA